MREFEERHEEKYEKHYSECARRYLNSLTTATLIKERKTFMPRARDEKEVLMRLLKIL